MSSILLFNSVKKETSIYIKDVGRILLRSLEKDCEIREPLYASRESIEVICYLNEFDLPKRVVDDLLHQHAWRIYLDDRMRILVENHTPYPRQIQLNRGLEQGSDRAKLEYLRKHLMMRYLGEINSALFKNLIDAPPYTTA